MPNSSVVGHVCGASKICHADGRCTCEEGTCPTGQRCDGLDCVCDTSSCQDGCCDGQGRCAACLAFVTSTQYTGDLGGLAGADAECQARAAAAGLPGTYRAWLSDDSASPATRFRCTAANCSSKGYKRVDGVTITTNWTDLTDGALLNPLEVTEQLTIVDAAVWTDTRANGTGVGGAPCENWTYGENGVSAPFGGSRQSDSAWMFTGGGALCGALAALYCFQQI